ncbi:DUF427 domain-containing protein [Aspergillus clavatus NRRL 1]|uniref:DUF427 domain protein n=1 Tax=Aspergillus clavatus (strain ATCC 1007 / CBS 513.65 / DSM 816 / NCTC 3887 / NRRL 1 / QM 1276 / 107) TaxID=344612 RepID=A1CCK0_ASPCL|nr:DUF427 domain protein [Aspergillus clavatus NRRL 1]EAW12257.1 DUF427 domain protein [Aspergillus clavatus NRRL 1]
MPRAIASVDGTVLAETDTWETVEGNVYFPPSAIKNKSLFTSTDLSTHCPWKGDASYYTVTIGDKTLPNVAWYYPQPFDAAKNIKDYVAFYKNKVNIDVE